jgi:hypothetical protein
MPRIISGVETIAHDDGSYTTYTVEHYPQTEELSMKAQVFIFLGTIGTLLGLGALPVVLDVAADRRDKQKRLDDRQKKNREIFYQAKRA